VPACAFLPRYLDEGTMRLIHLGPATILLAALGGCAPREPAEFSEAPVVRSMTIQPQQRSFLDPGPAPARLSGPGYTRDSGASFAGRSDSFGGSVLPSF
jgi:hypothetical protein